MERVAGLLVADLAAQGLSLDYTTEGLVRLDRLLANYGHSKGNGSKNAGLVELAGAYFGEVLRRNLAGIGSKMSRRMAPRDYCSMKPLRCGFGAIRSFTSSLSKAISRCTRFIRTSPRG